MAIPPVRDARDDQAQKPAFAQVRAVPDGFSIKPVRPPEIRPRTPLGGRGDGFSGRVARRERKDRLSQHLIDTHPTISQCGRCGAYVIACLVGGVSTAADTAPLDLGALRAALVAGRMVYRLGMLGGRAQVLRPLRPGDVIGRQGWSLVAEHPCGALAVKPIRRGAQGPATARVSAIGPLGSRSALRAPHAGAQPLAPASDATPRPSRLRRCDHCREIIREGDVYWGVESGSYLWAIHDECPESAANVT